MKLNNEVKIISLNKFLNYQMDAKKGLINEGQNDSTVVLVLRKCYDLDLGIICQIQAQAQLGICNYYSFINFLTTIQYTPHIWGCKNHIKIYLDILYEYKINIYLNIIIQFVMLYLLQKFYLK